MVDSIFQQSKGQEGNGRAEQNGPYSVHGALGKAGKCCGRDMEPHRHTDNALAIGRLLVSVLGSYVLTPAVGVRLVINYGINRGRATQLLLFLSDPCF